MKLNKILMSTLVGCSLLTPVILSSCSIKNSSTSSNDEEQKPKTIPVPFQSSLYDTWDPASSRLTFCSFSNPTYEIPNVEEWFSNESNNGRNYYKSTKINNNFSYDFYACDNDNDSMSNKPISSNPLFKTIDEFYTWIRKSENNYEVFLQSPNDSQNKLFNFNIFNWDFITNPNCGTSIHIYTHDYASNVITNTKYIWRVEIWTYPRIGYEWQINRYDDNGNYNNHRTIIFEFYFNGQTASSNQ